MNDKEKLDFDSEGEKIVNQQIMEAYQSGVIDNVDGKYNVFTGEEKQPRDNEEK